jgi:hypothetical protein
MRSAVRFSFSSRMDEVLSLLRVRLDRIAIQRELTGERIDLCSFSGSYGECPR